MKKVLQLGFVSIEVMAALVVVIAGLGLGMQWLGRDADTKINQAAAQQALAIMDGATAYIRANYSTVLTAANPLVTYSTTDIAANLGSNFATVNPYGQSYSIRVNKTAANKLETMVVTTGGETISESNLRQIAQMMGGAGGFVSSLDTSKAQGSYGGWSMPFTNYGGTPGGGKIAGAVFFSDGQVVSDYLYRNAVAGHPEYNQMNTALGMNANNISNVGTLQGKVADLSNDGQATCCAPSNLKPTLMLSENTGGTGHTPMIQFHSAGYSEGFIALNGPNEPRRINFRDNQGAGLGIDTTGQITAPSVKVPGGNNLIVGSSALYGDSTNSVIRQNGDFYIQHFDGSNTSAHAANFYADYQLYSGGDVTAANNVVANRLLTHVNDYGIVLRDQNWQDNVQPGNPNGSAYLNDIWIRSMGRWASSLNPAPKNYAEWDWYQNYGSWDTGLNYWQWFCALSEVGGKFAGGGEDIKVYRDGNSGHWIIWGSSMSDSGGAHAHVACVQMGS